MNSAGNLQSPPTVLKQILSDSLDAACNDLDSLFTVCDDLFFDLSSRANSDAEENLYFECMREIRSNSTEALEFYQHAIIANFAAMIKNEALPFSTIDSSKTKHDLKLIDNDQLEIDIAVNNLAANTRRANQEALTDIILRFDHLLDVEVTQDNCPLDPGNLGAAFASACSKHFSINNKCLVIILKQYERHILQRVGLQYTAANQLLADDGVLPEISESMRHKIDNESPHPETRGEQARRADDPIAMASRPVESGLQFDMGNLSSLVAAAKNASNEPMYTIGDFTYTNYGANPGSIMPGPELLLGLNAAQPQVAQAQSDIKPRNIIREIIAQLLTQKQPDLPQALSENEDNIINLVSMFFDFILDDANIPMAIKLQISRLQIAILKSALRDREFFSSNQHPGRILINTIAAIGIGFDDSKPPEKDPTFRAITQVTENINSQYSHNDDIFSHSLIELRKVIDKEGRKSTIIEKRTDQDETGRSRLRLAKTLARDLLGKRLNKVNLPESIQSLLLEKWLDVLIMVYLKSGEDSSEWVNASQTVDDLIWVCQEHSSQKAIARLNEFNVGLTSRVKEGLDLINEHIDSQAAILATIEELIYQAEQNNIDCSQFVELDEEQVSRAMPKDETINGTAPSAIQQQKEIYLSLAYGFIQKAEQMALGTWVNYMDQETGRELRCKLACKLENNETYIFVNRFGFKSLVKHRKEFAYDMQRGRATPLDSTPLFDRIFEKINNNLKIAGNTPA